MDLISTVNYASGRGLEHNSIQTPDPQDAIVDSAAVNELGSSLQFNTFRRQPLTKEAPNCYAR